MKRIIVNYFLVMIFSFHGVQSFIVHQPRQLIKTYQTALKGAVRPQKFRNRAFLKRFLRSNVFSRRFLRFFSTTLFSFKQRFPIIFKQQKALFSTKVDLKSVLIGYLNQERQKVSIAIYLLTDRDIANAIVRTHKRGVQVEIITDKKTAGGINSQISFLEKNGIPVFFYECPECPSSLMHQKFAIFSGQKLVWNGSFNFTKTASEKNRENVVLMKNEDIFEQFEQNFDELKQEVVEKAPKD